MSEVAESLFMVTDDQKAEWCIQQIKNAEADKAFWKSYYKEQYKSVEETADTTIANMKAMLQDYFERVPHKKSDTQESYKLPSGKLVMKDQDPEYERNDAEVIEWLKANKGQKYIKVTESLDWNGLKPMVSVIGESVATVEGEIIPGIKVTQRERKFNVEGIK